MFPLSETFIVIGLFALGIGVGTVCLFALLRVSWRLGAFLGIGAAALVLGLVLIEGDLFREVTTAHFWSLIALCLTPAFALVWALVVWFWVPNMARGIALCLLPALVIAGAGFARQTVPDDICSQSHIPLQIGQGEYHLPPELGGAVKLEGQGGFLTYVTGIRRKEDMRRLCKVTEGGHTLVKADQMRIMPSILAYPIHLACSGDTPAQFCEGYQGHFVRRIGSLSVMKRDETSLRHEMSQQGKTKAEGIVFEGDEASGYMCKVVPNTRRAGHCRLWKPLGEDTVVLITSLDSYGTDDVEVAIAELEDALAFYLEAIAR
ncbi:hypothetical protein KO498_13825 [Lentibacter algarum]|uniref:hypothetical protein n=1 Tax=Lentibacter algarum TaxID=576131 RepID=UPI001C085895|nr:hypothetical protein [Lentibacter algarum]MBU2982892.1 hypothetical protein [Lentibacter algarum]